jgi:hypothetical protein
MPLAPGDEIRTVETKYGNEPIFIHPLPRPSPRSIHPSRERGDMDRPFLSRNCRLNIEHEGKDREARERWRGKGKIERERKDREGKER